MVDPVPSFLFHPLRLSGFFDVVRRPLGSLGGPLVVVTAAVVLSSGVPLRAEDDLVLGWSMPGDTPGKLADPEATRQKIDRLHEQDHWTKFATPEEIALFDGPETEWPEIPRDQYKMDGVDKSIIGSKVPPPGVHPRIFFSPEDVPALRKKLIGTKRWIETEEQMKKTILNPESDDGKVFAKLASGDLEGLEFPDDGAGGNNGKHLFKAYSKPGIYAAHVCYWPRNLNAIGFYALMKDDKELGKRAANALVNYYKLREPLIDKQNARADDPNAEGAWPGDTWRGMHYVAGEGHLGFAYDMTAMHMTPEQKEFMRKIIVKATAGKRAYGQSAPVRWRDTNWVGWDTQHNLAHLAIEGQEGYEPELLDSLRDTVYGYFTYGVSPHGTIFETNGKNSAGFQYAFNSLIAVARRGQEYLLGHPHLRKLAESQTHQVVPAGSRNNNNGTYGCTLFKEAGYLKNLYPNSPVANWLIQQGQPVTAPEDLEAYREKLAKEKSLYRISPLETSSYLGMADYEPVEGKEPWERDHLNLPLDYEDPVHGQLATRSSNDKDALYLMTECRPDLYTGGHQHYDAGHFYLSADGVDWGVEGNNGIRASRFHSVVLINGVGQGANGNFAPSRGEWLGVDKNEHGAFAKMNLKNAYDYIWANPMHYAWALPERKNHDWKPITDPYVVACYKGTQAYKTRLWMHDYWNWNWSPQLQATWNPVEYAFRTAGIVRGPEPYAVIVDDIKKNGEKNLYEWQMQLPAGIVPYTWWKMPAGITVLARASDMDAKGNVQKGAPLLAVLVLGKETDGNDPQGVMMPTEIRKQLVTKTDRLVISTIAVDPSFKIALVPFRQGEPVPTVDKSGDSLGITWMEKDKAVRKEEIVFAKGEDNRTRFTVKRDGQEIVKIQ